MRPFVLAIAVAASALPSIAHAGEDTVDLLVFTRTTGFRHDSIPAGIAAVEAIAADRGWTTLASEDPALFQPASLAAFDVIVFLSTTGDVLDPAQEAALQAWVQDGGGFVGIHSATNTEEEWPWFVGLLGTTFADHPAPQTATIHVEDATHPATARVPDPWVRFDEWYNFDSDPAGAVNVLLWLDETSYAGGTMGESHPIAWSHEYDGGRSFYTALGHTSDSWSEPEFLAHVAGGIAWAATPEPAGGGSGSGDGDGGSEGGADTTGGASSEGTTDGGPPAAGTSGEPEPEPPPDGSDDASTTTNPASEAAQRDGCGCGSSMPPMRGGLPLALVLLVIATDRRAFAAQVRTRSPARASSTARDRRRRGSR